VVGESVNPVSEGALIVNVAVAVFPLSVPVIVAVVLLDTGVVPTGNVADELPAGTVTLA